MKSAIIQSSFIPWKGYFDIIHTVDTFIFLEDVQYTKRDWRNRNKLKSPNGEIWISVPVIVASPEQKIFETKIDYSTEWVEKIKKTIHHNYAASKFYSQYKDQILSLFDKKFETISEFNINATKKISSILGIKTKFINSLELATSGKKDDRLIEICKKIGADSYLSGPSAKDYISNTKFESARIELLYVDYLGYPEYSQLWGNFTHYVSIIDLIFNCGPEAPYYIWGWRNGKE